MKTQNASGGSPDMLEKKSQFRAILTTLILVAITTVLLNRTAPTAVSAGNGTVSVIVELQDEPGAVYKARAEKSGSSVSPEQLASYRSQLSAKQDEFLQA